MTDQPEPDDTCRTVEIDGENIRVRSAAPLDSQSEEALADLLRAARRRMANEQRAAIAKYPYQDGETTVLGPEIFASSDGQVISWKGENYVPQSAPSGPPATEAPGATPLVDRPFRSLRQKPEAPCAQHPTAPVIGGMCGGCTQYPSDMTKER